MTDDRKQLVELARTFKAGFLVTHADSGQFHGRPMELAKVTDEGELYFSTSLKSLKLRELAADPTVGVFFQEPKHYVSIYGKAEVLRDPDLIDELWQESWRLWFPDGKTSEDLCLIRVHPESGEYWDISGRTGARFLFNALRTYATGTRHINPDEGHAKVALG